MDFTDSNKACPKDCYPLLQVDILVDATIDHALISFMDVYSRKNHIGVFPEDEEKTSFITDQGMYCYKVMPFGLKNARVTYQRLFNFMLRPLIGKSMEVYTDDPLVKSMQEADNLQHLLEAFNILKKIQMKLNSAKCGFGVASGKFLGHIVTR